MSAEPKQFQTEIELQHDDLYHLKYRDIYEDIPYLLASVEASTARIIQCNRTFARVLDYRKEALLGRLVFYLYHPRSRLGAIQAYGAFLKKGEIHDARLQLRRKDGSPVDIILNVSSVRDRNGMILYSRSICREVSEPIHP